LRRSARSSKTANRPGRDETKQNTSDNYEYEHGLAGGSDALPGLSTNIRTRDNGDKHNAGTGGAHPERPAVGPMAPSREHPEQRNSSKRTKRDDQREVTIARSPSPIAYNYHPLKTGTSIGMAMASTATHSDRRVLTAIDLVT